MTGYFFLSGFSVGGCYLVTMSSDGELLRGYVEANAEPSHLGLFMRAMASYLGAYYGPNDGVVAVEDQTIPGLGTSLGILDAGHADLTRRFPSARMGRGPRRALIRSIVMAVGRSDAPSASPQKPDDSETSLP